jgi:hypothetical protein
MVGPGPFLNLRAKSLASSGVVIPETATHAWRLPGLVSSVRNAAYSTLPSAAASRSSSCTKCNVLLRGRTMMLFCRAAAPGNSFGIQFFTWATDCSRRKPRVSPSIPKWVRFQHGLACGVVLGVTYPLGDRRFQHWHRIASECSGSILASAEAGICGTAARTRPSTVFRLNVRNTANRPASARYTFSN